MKRLLPSPLLALALALLWLLLNGAGDATSWLGAAVVGLAVPVLVAPLRPERARRVGALPALRLAGVVIVDVLVSTVQVAAGVLRSGTRPPRSAFVEIPLDMRDAHALAALAIVTTVVPGTVWSELAPDRRSVVLHVFDVDDPAAFVAHYKQRYERPLQEIFE